MGGSSGSRRNIPSESPINGGSKRNLQQLKELLAEHFYVVKEKKRQLKGEIAELTSQATEFN